MSLLEKIRSNPLPSARLLLVAVGMVLSIVSAAGWCNLGSCSETHDYVIFMKLPLGVLGVAYFGMLALVLGARIKWTGGFTATIWTLALAAGFGGEVVFWLIQKNVIGSYCPVCVGVALILVALLNIELYEFVRSFAAVQFRRWRFWLSLLMVVASFLFGFSVTLLGAPGKAADIKAAAQTGELQSDLFLGRPDSPVELLVFEDWFCPGCRAAEPAIDAAVAAAGTQARIMRVTLPIHPDSVNYIPYDALFARLNKDKYPELRARLLALAEKGVRSPSYRQVEREVAGPLGVSLEPLNMLDAYRALTIYTMLSRQYAVRSTPTVVVHKGAFVKSLVGSKEISASSIAKVLAEAAKQ